MSSLWLFGNCDRTTLYVGNDNWGLTINDQVRAGSPGNILDVDGSLSSSESKGDSSAWPCELLSRWIDSTNKSVVLDIMIRQAFLSSSWNPYSPVPWRP